MKCAQMFTLEVLRLQSMFNAFSFVAQQALNQRPELENEIDESKELSEHICTNIGFIEVAMISDECK